MGYPREGLHWLNPSKGESIVYAFPRVQAVPFEWRLNSNASAESAVPNRESPRAGTPHDIVLTAARSSLFRRQRRCHCHFPACGARRPTVAKYKTAGVSNSGSYTGFSQRTSAVKGCRARATLPLFWTALRLGFTKSAYALPLVLLAAEHARQ